MRIIQALKPSRRISQAIQGSSWVSKRSSHVLADNQQQIPSVKLYQYAICPFCNKVKAVLSYAGIDHEVVEVNPLTKAEIKWSKDYRKVPIATIDDAPFNGSDEIVDGLLKQPAIIAQLEEQWDGRMNMADFADSESAKHWIKYANDDLASLLYPNICRTLNDSYAAFGYVNTVDTFSPVQRVAIRGLGSLAMYYAAGKVKKKRNITDERQALDDVLSILEKEGLGESKKFLSGKEEPHLGDLAVFGTLRSVEGLPTHAVAVQNRGGSIMEWYEQMTAKLQHK